MECQEPNRLCLNKRSLEALSSQRHRREGSGCWKRPPPSSSNCQSAAKKKPHQHRREGARYNIARLRNPDVSKNFFIAVKNKYEALSNIDEEAEKDAESAWRIAKEGYLHACECVPGKKRKRDENWISAKTWSLIDKRREIKEKKESARSQRLIEKLSVEYSLANREVRKKIR